MPHTWVLRFSHKKVTPGAGRKSPYSFVHWSHQYCQSLSHWKVMLPPYSFHHLQAWCNSALDHTAKHSGKGESVQALLHTLGLFAASCQASPRPAHGNLSVHEHVYYATKTHWRTGWSLNLKKSNQPLEHQLKDCLRSSQGETTRQHPICLGLAVRSFKPGLAPELKGSFENFLGKAVVFCWCEDEVFAHTPKQLLWEHY